MRIDRAQYDPGEVLEFYEQGLAELGALCERTWHDRLEIVAEGRAAALWKTDGALHEVELHFAPGDAKLARDPLREVFPGCPLTFQLAEALRNSPVPLDRFVLAEPGSHRPPDPAVVEKLWRAQFPETRRWQLVAPFTAAFHFNLVALSRCEIQAIDQHWSLHRLAISLPGGEPDQELARELGFDQTAAEVNCQIRWPVSDPSAWSRLLKGALEDDLGENLGWIRVRQETSLRRELERIDEYFANYEHELTERAGRGSKEQWKGKAAERLAAAKAEHARRRADQLARHGIRIHQYIDALMLVAEKAWRAELRVDRAHSTQTLHALFTPRSRRWDLVDPKSPSP